MFQKADRAPAALWLFSPRLLKNNTLASLIALFTVLHDDVHVGDSVPAVTPVCNLAGRSASVRTHTHTLQFIGAEALRFVEREGGGKNFFFPQAA